MAHFSAPKAKVEDYRQGYPRLAAFLCADEDFMLFKRFDQLHMRVLLDLQDELMELKASLDECDDREAIQLHLSSRRQDGNIRRREILRNISTKLESYDRTVIQYQQMLALPQATPRNRQSVKNWIEGNKPLVRSESICFLENSGDNDFVAPRGDTGDEGLLEALIEVLGSHVPGLMKYISKRDMRTSDQNVLLIRPQFIQSIVRWSSALIVPAWLIVPIVLLYNATHPLQKTIICSVFILATSFSVVSLTQVSKYNLVLAVVSYGAVLAAFMSST